ncbi:MAG: shikimate kinase [Frankiaceae bacterium]
MSGPVLVVVGPPGAGKTTVGEQVARHLGVAFRDTDADVEQAAGKTVADIFLEDGEDRFRELERAAVAAALARHEGVLALGGGAVLDEATRDALAAHRVVLLDVGLADAAKRVGLARDRPLLLGNPRAQLSRLLDARRPHYRSVATHVVATDGRSPEEVVADVLALVRRG